MLERKKNHWQLDWEEEPAVLGQPYIQSNKDFFKSTVQNKAWTRLAWDIKSSKILLQRVDAKKFIGLVYQNARKQGALRKGPFHKWSFHENAPRFPLACITTMTDSFYITETLHWKSYKVLLKTCLETRPFKRVFRMLSILSTMNGQLMSGWELPITLTTIHPNAFETSFQLLESNIQPS